MEPCLFVPYQPTCAAASDQDWIVDIETFLDGTGDQLPQLRGRQSGGPDFFPAASPGSGTTRQAATGSGGDATLSISLPGSRPTPPHSWRARSILRSDLPSW